MEVVGRACLPSKWSCRKPIRFELLEVHYKLEQSVGFNLWKVRVNNYRPYLRDRGLTYSGCARCLQAQAVAKAVSSNTPT
jgi:hypothetical protein